MSTSMERTEPRRWRLGRPGRAQAGAARRLATLAVSLVLVAAGLVTTAAPVAAARNLPWRFVQVTSPATGVGYDTTKGWELQCPAGYTPVSGGITSISNNASEIYRLLEYPNPAAGTFHVMVRNGWEGTNVTVAATCVWLDDVGAITTVWGEFARNASGRAGGYTWCPAGTTVLSGGTDWSGTDVNRRIEYSTVVPDANGQASGWYVAGYSPTSGDKLYVELRCVSASLTAGEYFEADDSTTEPTGTATAQCANGYRLLTGGAAPAGTRTPGTSQGRALISGPVDYRQWTARGYVGYSGIKLRAYGLCVPASTVNVTYTQTPAAVSTASSGTIAYSATDSAGETLVLKCYLDGVQRSCGSPSSYGPLLDGSHYFLVNATNQSGSQGNFTYSWRIDATAPLVSGHTPTSAAPLNGPLTITFSEPVQGVTASSVTVHAEAANVDITGTVARPSSTTATWTPSTRLVPGETYRVSLTSAVTDVAGNSLTPTYFTVRAATTVEDTDAALQRLWDVDTKTIASGGSYIVSRLAGSRAEHTFTATAGQTISVYGIRMPDGGYADIYLDGVKKATPSFYAATATRARVYLSPALSAGTHTISIRPLGTKPAASSNSWVAVDNVAVGATVTQQSALRQIFRRVSSASAYGGSYESITQSTATDTTPAQFRLTMVGTGFKVYATKTSTSGKARVYVDGVLKATINLNSASTVYKALVYSTTLAPGQHVIRIEAVGTSTGANSAVNLDRITVN